MAAFAAAASAGHYSLWPFYRASAAAAAVAFDNPGSNGSGQNMPPLPHPSLHHYSQYEPGLEAPSTAAVPNPLLYPYHLAAAAAMASSQMAELQRSIHRVQMESSGANSTGSVAMSNVNQQQQQQQQAQEEDLPSSTTQEPKTPQKSSCEDSSEESRPERPKNPYSIDEILKLEAKSQKKRKMQEEEISEEDPAIPSSLILAKLGGGGGGGGDHPCSKMAKHLQLEEEELKLEAAELEEDD